MTGELARTVLGSVEEHKPAKELRWRDRGRLVALETPTAVYVGVLTAFIMHKHDALRLYIKRDDYETDMRVEPEQIIYFAPREERA